MNTADQILSAKIAATTRRHAARGVIDDIDSAVAELRELAGHRPGLLAEHAGACLGLAEVGPDIMAAKFQAGLSCA